MNIQTSILIRSIKENGKSIDVLIGILWLFDIHTNRYSDLTDRRFYKKMCVVVLNSKFFSGLLYLDNLIIKIYFFKNSCISQIGIYFINKSWIKRQYKEVFWKWALFLQIVCQMAKGAHIGRFPVYHQEM